MSLNRRLGGRRQGADFMLAGRRRGKPILVVGGGKNLTFRREVDSAGASQDPGLGGPERRIAGTPAGDDVTLFWTIMGQELGAEVEFVNGATNIDRVNFMKYSIVVVAGDQWETYYGGLTAAEHDALSVRADDLRDFIASGGGVVASTSGFRSRYFQTPLLPFSGLPAYRVTSTWGAYAYLRTALPAGLTTRFFNVDDLEHMWQSQIGPTFALGTYNISSIPSPVVAAGAGSMAQAWAQTPVPWYVTPSTIGEVPQTVLPSPLEFEITIPGDSSPGGGNRTVVGAVARIAFDNATQWLPGAGSFRYHIISMSGGRPTDKGPRILHMRGGVNLGTFAIPSSPDAELINTGVWQSGINTVPSTWPDADRPTASTTPIETGDEMLIMTLFGNLQSDDCVMRIRFNQIDFWSFTGYTNADPTSGGSHIGLTAQGFTAVVSPTGGGSHRWMHTFPTLPSGLESIALAGGTAIRYRNEPAIAAGFNRVQGRGTVMLVGCPWEDGVFYDPAAVGVPGQTLPKIPTETVPTGNPNEFVSRPVGNPNRQCGAFDGWVRLMREVVAAVERAGVPVARTGVRRRPWAAQEEVQLV